MKLAIIGAGQVGAASAYACLLQGLASEMIILDINKAYATAQAKDLLHAAPFSEPAHIIGTDNYADISGAEIIVIAAGVAQKDGETRIDLLKRNAAILESIVPQILDNTNNPIILVATNPVDVITSLTANIAHKTHKLDRNRVIGTGTMLDTARFRALIAEHAGVSSHSVHAHVLGEHGDSEVLHWSGSQISNMPLENFAVQTSAPLTKEVKEHIDYNVRNAAYEIIHGKGATWFGIGAAVARMVEVISNNEKAALTCSAVTEEIVGIKNACVSIPRIIGAQGVIQNIDPLLTNEEEELLKISAQKIQACINEIQT